MVEIAGYGESGIYKLAVVPCDFDLADIILVEVVCQIEFEQI